MGCKLTHWTWPFNDLWICVKIQRIRLLSEIKLLSYIRPFYKGAPLCGWLWRGQNVHWIMGICWQTECCAVYKITHEHVSNDRKIRIKQLHTEIHNIIAIYTHYRYIYVINVHDFWFRHFRCLCKTMFSMILSTPV